MIVVMCVLLIIGVFVLWWGCRARGGVHHHAAPDIVLFQLLGHCKLIFCLCDVTV